MLNEELIARRPRGRKGLPEWYAEVFEAQRTAGLTCAEVAGHLRTTATNIYYWRKRLRRLELGAASVDGAAPAGLVRVALRDGGTPVAPGDRFQVHLPRGRAVTVAPDFDAAALGRLVTALESC